MSTKVKTPDHTFYMLLLCCLVTITFSSFATPPRIPRLVPVEDGEKYKHLILQSDVVRALTEWRLVEVGIPEHIENRPWPVYVTLKYDLPQSYSLHGLQYHLPLTFNISSDTISNLLALWTLGQSVKSEIEEFEHSPAVAFFLHITRTKEVFRRGNTFHSKNDTNYISYNYITDSVESFWFKHEILIDSLHLYVPAAAPFDQVRELDYNIGITMVQQTRGKLHVRADHVRRKRYRGDFTYRYAWGVMEGFSLPNDFVWVTFPDIARAHKIIVGDLLKGDLSSCSIGKGRGHSYTIGSYFHGPLPFYSITVALKCGNQQKGKDASLRLFSNGAYDRLNIKREYH